MLNTEYFNKLTAEELEAINAKREARKNARRIDPRYLREEYKAIILPLIRRECKAMKNATVNDIEYITASTRPHRVRYRVFACGKHYVI